MKKWSIFAFLVGVPILCAAIVLAAVVYSGYLVNEPALAYSKDYTLDLKTGGVRGRSIKSVAATAAYSSATVSAVEFTDGGKSTNNLTVDDNDGLVGVKATGQITVTSTATIKNAVLYVNGVRLRAFYEWKVGATTAATATNIATVVNRLAGIDASAASNVVYATATAAGVAGNSITLAKHAADGLSLSDPTFTGGVDNAYVTINGVTLTQGTHWTRADTSSGTAKAISDAIVANASLSSVIASTWTSGVVYATATAVGVNAYAVSASPALNLVWDSATFADGSAAAWTAGSKTITKTGHGLSTALPVLYTTGTVAITGLTDGTTYYAIRVNDNQFQLAATSTGAVAGLGITLATASSAGPHTYTLTPLDISGTFGFKWQTSDDNVTFVDVDVSSVTFASPYTAGSAAWNFGIVGHRYLRAAVEAGDTGGFNLQISLTGNSD